ncbi:MAG: biopolymer transporter ExbD [Opitutales bacterium]|nr:biopolymer transporter ExbD [Opitutales bacterium]
MRCKKRNYPEEGFQMAPMIDMVFLLLVFFMTVSSLADADKSKELNLPESEESKIPGDLSDRGTISVDAEGRIYLGTELVSEKEMKEAIRKLISQKPSASIVLRADQETPYRFIKSALKSCAESGAYEIVYATYQQ